MICHPTANFLGHYALAGIADRGFGAIGFTTRYVGNDTSLIMENCLLDMGAMVRFLYERGYERVVLVGNSGGASPPREFMPKTPLHKRRCSSTRPVVSSSYGETAKMQSLVRNEIKTLE